MLSIGQSKPATSSHQTQSLHELLKQIDGSLKKQKHLSGVRLFSPSLTIIVKAELSTGFNELMVQIVAHVALMFHYNPIMIY